MSLEPRTDGMRELRPALLGGALALLVFVCASAIVNPIVVDETLGSGAVLAELPPYPAGHPHVHFYERAFSLGNHVTAWALEWGVHRDAISLVRNGLALFLALFAPYAAALCFTRRMSLAIAAAVLAALEAPCAYDGLYPVLVFPDIYSHGQIGQSLAVLVAVAWIGGASRTAGFLTGAMPMLHAGVFPPLVLFTWLYLGLARGRPRGRELRRALVAVGLGMAACALFYWRTRVGIEPAVAIGPYAVPGGDPSAAFGFVALTDFHRQVPDFARFGYFAHGLALVGLALAVLRGGRELGERSNGADAAARWGLVLALVAWGYTLAGAALQRLEVLPHVVLMAMPSRVTNLSTILLAPLTVLAWQRALDRLTAPARAALWTLAGMAAVALAVWLWFRGPWTVRDHVLAFAWGCVLGAGAAAWPAARRTAIGCTLALAAACVLFALEYPQPPRHLALGAGFVLAVLFALASRALREPLLAVATRAAPGLALTGGVLAACANIPTRHADFGKQFRCDVLSRDDRHMIAWMSANVGPEEPLVTAAWVRLEMQQKTAHPVLVETETLWMLTYMPELGAAVGPMVKDFFEVDYTDAQAVLAISGGGRLALTDPHWSRVWRERSAARWGELAETYDFELVVSPQDTPLQLPCVVDGERVDLYRVPRD